MDKPNEPVVKQDNVEVELFVETVADKQEPRLRVAGLCYCCCVVLGAEEDPATELLPTDESASG